MEIAICLPSEGKLKKQLEAPLIYHKKHFAESQKLSKSEKTSGTSKMPIAVIQHFLAGSLKESLVCKAKFEAMLLLELSMSDSLRVEGLEKYRKKVIYLKYGNLI